MLKIKVALLTFMCFTCFATCFAQNDSLISLHAAAFNRILHLNPNAICIDVRIEKDFKKGHLPGAYSAETSDILFHLIDSLGINKTYLIYCEYGERSRSAGKLIYKKRGISIISLEEGLEEWEQAGLDLVK